MKTLLKNITIAASIVTSSTVFAQDKIYVCKKDGSYVEYAISDIDSISLIKPALQEQPPVKEKSFFLYGDNVDDNGPLAFNWDENVGPSGNGVVAYPKELSNDPNVLHPVAIFCPGGGETPNSQPTIPKRLASMGFVVYSQPSTWDGNDAKKAFDWLEQMNNDPSARFYGKLNMERVAICGHSQGGVMAEDCANKDSRVAVLMLLNSGSFSHDGATNLTIPTGFITGHTDMAYDNAVGDYGNSANKAPMWLGIKGNEGHGYGPWGGSNCCVAWIRWHLCGETKWQKEFMEGGGKFNRAGGWEVSTKNW